MARKMSNGHSQPSHHRLNRGWSRASSLMTEAEALGRVRGVRGIQHQDQYYQDQHGATAAAVAAACESRGRFRSVPASPLESESATSHSQSSDGRSSSRVEEKFSSDVVSRVGGFMSRRSGSRSLGAQGGAAGAEAASYPSHTTHGQIGYPSSEARENGNISLNLSVSEFNDLSFLAQGSMCKCFVAKSNPVRPCPVVLKMAIENGPREAERDLNSELALLQKLSHPNLTTLMGAGLTPKGKTFIVMEYLDGGSLRRRLDAARGGLGFWPAARHALELASAMKYLHHEAIPGTCVMHRDLKPDNLGFSGNVMKLFDLGLAKVIPKAGENDFYRMSGEVGSLRYMSPEVANLQPYNEKADVHSFAVVMWELVTGWLPFSGLSPDQFMFQVVQHGQRPLMQFGWDPVFKGLLASCWAEDPRDRPGFSQIHETLDRLVAEKGTPAAPRRRASDDKIASNPSGSRAKGGMISRLLGKPKNNR